MLMTSPRFLCALAAASLLPAASSLAAVSFAWNDGDATPTSTVAGAGVTFNVNVVLNESATTDRVSGVDYRPLISNNGSGKFKITSRLSSNVLTPALPDTNPLIAPVLLYNNAPTNPPASTNYGGDRNGNSDLAGIQSYTLASYAIQVLAGTANGTYTLTFNPANADYTGASPTTPTVVLTSASLGVFTITVPEPTTLAGIAGLGIGILRRRRRRDR